MRDNSHKNSRLFPSLFNSAYYILVQLRVCIEDIAKKYIKNNSVIVDVGCGDKPYYPIFSKKTAKYIGVDLTGNPKADIFIDENKNIPLEDNQADIVLSTQVLEHVVNPQSYLGECLRILKPSGLLILSTHGYWVYHQDPEDYWRWTSPGLKLLCEQAGFNILELRGLMGIIPTSIQLFQDSVLESVPKQLQLFKGIFIFISQSLIMLIDRFHSDESRKRNASVFLIVAKKNV